MSKSNLYINSPCSERQYGDISAVFKLDCLQPSGSFKDRGISHMITVLKNRDPSVNLLITSSGGNAGHSVALIGKKLGIPVHVYVPITTKQLMIDKIKRQDAEVFIGGANWNEADTSARIELSNTPTARYIPPFDNELLWEGHATIVDELVESFGQANPPDAIIVSVGGGGLLCGIQQGLQRNGWENVSILAVETNGTHSFSLAKANNQVVALDKITSIASSLGALAVTPATLNSSINTISIVVSDKQAVDACINFANDQRMLVEPACGTVLSLIYIDELRQRYIEGSYKKVVVVVCGGSAVSLELLNQWSQSLS
eukprot:gene21621-27984_t